MAFLLKKHTENYTCLSTDTKLTTVQAGSKCEEIDTGKEYIFDGTDWNQIVGATTLTGSLANIQTDAIVLANADILTTDFTPTQYSKSVLQIMSDTAGILSLVVDGVSGTLNSGLALTANAWYEFDVSLLSGSTYNLQLSVGATMQVKWQVI